MRAYCISCGIEVPWDPLPGPRICYTCLVEENRKRKPKKKPSRVDVTDKQRSE